MALISDTSFLLHVPALRSAKGRLLAVALLYCTILLAGCTEKIGQPQPADVDTYGARGATAITAQVNQDFLAQLDFSDTQDFEDASRGLIDTLPEGIIYGPDPRHPIWDLNQYTFLKNPTAPASVNPSLWRQARLNMANGLFKVTDHIYQIRGFDISNMTIVEGQTGLIIIDPLLSPECAAAGLKLYYKHFPQKPISAVIYTHSHVDHYGGVKGIITEAQVQSGQVQVIAPEGFLEEAVSENVYVGNAMGRRAQYMYGVLLPRNERGQVDGGLGKSCSMGTSGLIAPNRIIATNGETLTIDGVSIEFLLVPGTEAPAEMMMYFPQFKALCSAEDCTHTLHNLYTLRGAQVRDANRWWQALNTAASHYGEQTEVMFAQHHWPVWGSHRVVELLHSQRNLYKYIHDQSLHLANQGHTMLEVGEMLQLPTSIGKNFANRGYYGSVNHDAKAVYNRYLGFYSSNPSDLHPLVPEEAAKKFIEYMGGADAVMAKARKDFDKGEYRWVAQVMNQVVFADPANKAARELTADALEQLGYQSENATWRNEYLVGALELRNGISKVSTPSPVSPETVKAMPLAMLFDYMGIRLNAQRAENKQASINFVVKESGETYLLSLEDCVLIYTLDKQNPQADATLTLNQRASLNAIITGETTLDEQLKSGAIEIQGSTEKMTELFGLLDNFEYAFNISTP